MKLTLLAVTSIDGKLTRGKDSKIHSWTSAEDLEHYKKVLAATKVIIMGRRTFEAMHPSLSPDKLLVILTESPEQSSNLAVEGQLEFTNQSPADIVKGLEERGYAEAVLNGGGQVFGEFMAQDLVDELFLTIEPFAFGDGVSIFGGKTLNAELHLIDFTKLNDRGTLLLHYGRRN